jgi:ABC-type transport system involved in multi-copper enzyme maturation permease subunit
MTTVLTSVPTATLRPVPWHRLAWVAWRRYRSTLLALVSLIAVLAVLLIVRGHQIRDAYSAVQACAPQASARCQFAFQQFRDSYAGKGALDALFVWMPAIIGAFAGAPLLAREFESGTFRFAWTQGAGRTRWMLSLTIAGALGVIVLSFAFGLLVSWYQQPLFISGLQQRLHPSVFPVTGVAVVGWALFAFALGLFLGLLTRRVLPAIALTLATWTGSTFLASTVRDHYATPLTTSALQLNYSAVTVDQWWVNGGTQITQAQLDAVLQAAGVPSIDSGSVTAGPGNTVVDPIQYLIAHGYTQITSYHPDSRYWQFQWTEFGWLAVASLLLIGATLWLLRRRPA